MAVLLKFTLKFYVQSWNNFLICFKKSETINEAVSTTYWITDRLCTLKKFSVVEPICTIG
jgi:hypothetical protein